MSRSNASRSSISAQVDGQTNQASPQPQAGGLHSGISITPPSPALVLHPVKISYEDIADEISFRETSVVCYVLGANPPLHVIDGFVKRIWNSLDINKVGTKLRVCFLFDLKPKRLLLWPVTLMEYYLTKNRSLLSLGPRMSLMRNRALPLSLYGLGFPGLICIIGGIEV